MSGRFTGPEPKRVEGEWSIDLWLFSISGKIDKTFGPDRPPLELPSVDPLPDLIAALGNASNWSAPLPQDSRMIVSFRNRPGAAEVLVHPLGEIGVRQQLLPLGIELDRYAGGAPQGQRRFAITKAFVGTSPVTQLRPVNEQFAAGDFLDLTDDEKLHRPSFEAMPAGVTLQPKALAFGGQAPGTANQMAVSEIDFEEIVVDADGNVVRKEGAKPLSTLVLTVAVEFGPAALSSLRTGGSSRFSAPGPAFSVGPERFTVAGVARPRPGADGRARGVLARRREAGARASPEGQSAGPRHAAGRSRVPDRGARVTPGYRYLPWVREGAAHAYDTPDTLAPVLARTDNRPLSALPVALLVNDATRVDVPLRLYGPGDVIGIDPRAVLRTDPLGHTADFEPNYLACIEFDIPDFPWLFTPAAAGANGRLRPWLVLVVVRHAGDMPTRPTGDAPLPRIDVPVSELPDLSESWAWAHAQVVELDASQSVEQILGSQPERNLSRLVCPRRLEPETHYLACVVPAFEAGRKAGLGLEVTAADEDRLGPAWTATQTTARLPVYYHWEFATGTGGDFETLARRLTPRPVGDVGRRKLRVGRQPFGLPDAGVLQLEGALVAPGELTRPAPSAEFRTALRDLLNPGVGDPVVAPPVYGSWQAARLDRPRRYGEAGLAARAEPRPFRARRRRARRRRRPGVAGAARRLGLGAARRPGRGHDARAPPRGRGRRPRLGRASSRGADGHRPARAVPRARARAAAHVAADPARVALEPEPPVVVQLGVVPQARDVREAPRRGAARTARPCRCSVSPPGSGASCPSSARLRRRPAS